MTTAIIFPGQGSQSIGMGKQLYDAFTEAREVFEEIDETLGQKLARLIFEGEDADLRLTANAQPALMAVSMAVVRVLEKQGGFSIADKAAIVAGHSLGEYSALCAAGSLSLADTARLLRIRGNAMQQAVPVGVGAMAALIGADIAMAEEIAAAAVAGTSDICVAANDNAPGQVVISGHKAAVERAMVLATERGLKRSIMLPVSAPFHCSLMQPAADAMREALAAVILSTPRVAIVPNVTATVTRDPEAIRDLLVQQVTGAVRWRESVLYMQAEGVTKTIECGAGSVLSGLSRRVAREIATVALHTPQEIEGFLETQR